MEIQPLEKDELRVLYYFNRQMQTNVPVTFISDWLCNDE